MNVTHQRGAAIACAVTIALAAAGCGSSASNKSGAAKSSSGGNLPVAFLALGTNNTFVDANVAGAQAEAKKLGVKLTVLNGNFDPTTQLSQCSQVSSTHQYKAVILFAASGPALKPCGPEMKTAGIPLVADSQPLGDSVTTLKREVPGLVANVGEPLNTFDTGLVKATVQACRTFNPCNIAWFRTLSTLPQADSNLKSLLEAAVKAHSNMHIVAQADTGLTVQAGQQQIQQFLQRTHKINVLVSYVSQAVAGAIEGFKAAGLTPGTSGNDVRIVGNGGTKQEITAIRNGSLYATTIELPRTEGADSVLIAADAARGKSHPSSMCPECQPASGFPLIVNAAVLKRHPTFAGQWSS